MAGGKLSARQKMINLMYLVFIAMLAMKMDKKVLTAFGRVNETLHESNIKATEQNTVSLEGLATLASDQPKKYANLNVVAKSVNQKSSELYQYLEGLKVKILEKQEDAKDYESMDNAEAVDQLFFINDKLTDEGNTFVNNINNYKSDLLTILGDSISTDMLAKINKRFSTPVEKTSKNGEQEWIYSRYEGYPLVSTLTNITKIQSDIKSTETELYNKIVGNQMSDDNRILNKYDAMVVFNKSAYYPGQQLEGKIVLGKNDPTLVASKVVINGSQVNKNNISAGQVNLSRSAGNVGEHELKGKFYFMEGGEEISIDIVGGKYSVIPRPKDAVISADKMNVVYRGLPNPISISIPGISDNKVVGSAPGMTKTGTGKYIIYPPAQRTVNIVARGTLDDGTPVSTPKEFRVKGIPAPTGTLSGESGYLKMSKANLARKTVGAVLKDFVFDLKISVSSFKIKVPGKPTIEVSGTRFNAAAKRAIQRAKRGDVIIIFEIKAAPQGAKIRLKNTSQVSIQITS